MSTSAATLDSFRRPVRLDAAVVYPLIVVVGCILWWADHYRAASLPAFAPWEFEWTWYLAATLTLFWYLRGLVTTPGKERPAIWRQACFLIGFGLIYGVLQTHFEYMAQHMFFLNRAQHVVMHHLGPFLMVLAWPGDTLMRGMPALKHLTRWKPLVVVFRILQQPVIACTLFAGLVGFWLVPAIHFKAMIDPTLYTIMNWTMVGDGILFWCLVLDPRPTPAAPYSHATRMVASMAVMFPQIVIGAMIAFRQSGTSMHSTIGAAASIPRSAPSTTRFMGGLIAWIPAAMMSIAGLLWAINMLRINEEKNAEEFDGEEDEGTVISSAGWTGS